MFCFRKMKVSPYLSAYSWYSVVCFEKLRDTEAVGELGRKCHGVHGRETQTPALARQQRRVAEAMMSRFQKQIDDEQTQALPVCPMLGDLVSRNQHPKCGPRRSRASAHQP